MAMRVVAINHFIVMPTFSTAWWRCGCCERASSENVASSRDNDSFNTSRVVVSDNDSAPRRRQRQKNDSKKKKRRQRSESESIRLTLPQEQPQSKLLPPIDE